LGSHPVAVVQCTYTHTNNTENDAKQTIHRTTQKYMEHKKIHRTTQKFGRVRAVPRLCGFYTGICLTTEEKARKTLSQGVGKFVEYCDLTVYQRFRVYTGRFLPDAGILIADYATSPDACELSLQQSPQSRTSISRKQSVRKLQS